jgi:signal transduction histidine kinase
MTTLKDWIDANAKRPLALAIGAVLCLQAGWLLYMAHAEYSSQLRRIARVVETASLGMQQENRPLVESTLLAGLHNADAAAVALCRSGQADILYPPTAADLCRGSAGGILRWIVRRTVAGMDGLEFVFLLDGRRAFGSFAALSGLTAALLLAVIFILIRARRHFERDVLQPLYEGLGQDSPLAIAELDGLRRKNREHDAMSRKQAASEARYQLSAQVAHDIRSPLAALDSVIKELPRLPEAQRGIIMSAIGRIRDIADGLLANDREFKISASTAEPARTVLLASLIEPLIEEKRAQLRSKVGIIIDFRLDSSDGPIRATVQPVEFQRLLSNLINNAVEALNGGRGAVDISLALAGRDVLLAIEDNGRGIPAHVLAKLGERGETHGKVGGFGLGLHHAKACASSWGGSFNIQSKSGTGTRVMLQLPQTPRSHAGPDAILLDDDDLVRMTWKVTAKLRGIDLAVFKKPSDLISAVMLMPRETPIYLDSTLEDGIRGEDVGKRLCHWGFSNLYLATGREPAFLARMPWIRGSVGKEPPWDEPSVCSSHDC